MKTLMLLLTAVALAMTGCVVVDDGPYGSDYVIVAPGHSCTEGCCHYFFGGHWYAPFGHVHRPGCGHVLRGGMWIRVN